MILVLKLQFRQNFAGLLDSNDVTWAIEDNSKNIITILHLIEKPDFDIEQKLKDFVERISREKQKLFYNKTYKYGYFFWLRNQKINMEEHVRKIDTKGKNLQDILEENCNKMLPENHSRLWEVLIGDEIEENSVPVIFKIHHSVADGIHLLQFFNEYFIEDSIDICNPTKQINIFYRFREYLRSNFSSFWNFWLVLFSSTGYTVRQYLIRERKSHYLHGPEPSEEKLVEFLLEEEFSTFDAIKRIKNRITNCSFSDVVLTALSVAFCKFYEEVSIITRKQDETFSKSRQNVVFFI